MANCKTLITVLSTHSKKSSSFLQILKSHMSSVGGTSEPSNLTGSNKQTPNRKETFKQPNSTVPQGVEQNPPNHQYSKKTATKPSYEPVKIAYISYEKKATEKVTNVKLINSLECGYHYYKCTL